jgi:hypothetical protein
MSWDGFLGWLNPCQAIKVDSYWSVVKKAKNWVIQILASPLLQGHFSELLFILERRKKSCWSTWQAYCKSNK